ncbi:MAG: hypothetical protein MH825_12410 [Cyanobacteria bacterium]|nr:hypothetical protein [Cyanobacteriota bacterium]
MPFPPTSRPSPSGRDRGVPWFRRLLPRLGAGIPGSRSFFWLSLGVLAIASLSATWSILSVAQRSQLLAQGLPEAWRIPLAAAASLGLTLVLAVIFSLPFMGRRSVTQRALGSDVLSFATAIVGAFVVVLLLVWIETTAHLLVLMAAETLAKLELRTRGIKRWSMFVWLALAGSGGTLAATILFLRWSVPAIP